MKDVKTDLDCKISSEITKQAETVTAQVKTDLRNRNVFTEMLLKKQAEALTAHVETVQTDLTTQSEVVKQLQSEVRSLVTALREQTEMVMEQQRQTKESW